MIFSIISSGVLFFWNYWEEGTYCDFEDTVPQYYVIALGVVCHGAILIIVSGIHYRLHQKATSISKRNAKSAKTVGLVTGVYFLSWTPYSIILMVKSTTKTTSPLFDLIFQLTFRVSYANSFLNPFIYAWRNAEIRAALLWFIKKLSLKGSTTLGKHICTTGIGDINIHRRKKSEGGRGNNTSRSAPDGYAAVVLRVIIHPFMQFSECMMLVKINENSSLTRSLSTEFLEFYNLSAPRPKMKRKGKKIFFRQR